MVGEYYSSFFMCFLFLYTRMSRRKEHARDLLCAGVQIPVLNLHHLVIFLSLSYSTSTFALMRARGAAHSHKTHTAWDRRHHSVIV